MPELHNIPLTYKEGVHSVVDFSKDINGDDAISFDYDAQYQSRQFYHEQEKRSGNDAAAVSGEVKYFFSVSF